MANSYVTVSHDSFKNKTTTQSYPLEYKLNARRFGMIEKATFYIRHVSCEPNIDALLIDVHFRSIEANPHDVLKTYPGEWAFLRNGQLIIQINGVENIALTPHDAGSDVTTQNITDASACEELVFYQIDKEILQKICKAHYVRIQLSGSATNWILDGDDMIFLAKAFWNGFYDETMYLSDLVHAEEVKNKQNKIKKNGCLWQVVSVIVGILFSSFAFEYDESDIGGILFLIFLIVIPIYIAIRKRKKAKEIS